MSGPLHRVCACCNICTKCLCARSHALMDAEKVKIWTARLARIIELEEACDRAAGLCFCFDATRGPKAALGRIHGCALLLQVQRPSLALLHVSVLTSVTQLCSALVCAARSVAMQTASTITFYTQSAWFLLQNTHYFFGSVCVCLLFYKCFIFENYVQ